jgi:5-methylcytosine-specific restriction enzyme A
VRERNQKLAAKRKQGAMSKTGLLACEACGFDFAAAYGRRGEGFIECHHTVPLHELAPGSRTKLTDLALLCANCHRIVHRKAPWLTMDELRAALASAST